ncbi:fibronectin type III domain-containing protein [uncultured Eubacterium sp.]|uniref:fibronectin type III domain-containing protein n=1 Tax=uncultured Eubacterium sp. TaxID=165185 RepID=UPI0026140955|nr:fibronectin type III domain-containing protein [uncultured Eubacterium sp.]
MKNIKKMLCVLFAIVTVMTSILTVNTQAKNIKPPQATQIVKVYAAKNGMRVKWQVVNKVKGYQIQTARSKDFKKEKKTYTVAKPKASAKTLNDFKAKKTYYVRVRAYKKAGKKTIYSKWSNVKKFKSPNLMEIDGDVYIVCSTNDNHQCVCGNSGKWVDSKAECYDVFGDECDYWEEKYNEGKISMDEYLDNVPGGFECMSCAFCGKWTVDFNYDLFGGVFWKHPAPAHID